MTQTTWGIRFACPECGHESYTQDKDLAQSMLEHHHRRVHDGHAVGALEEVDDVPVSAFPESEDVAVGAGATVTSRALEVIGGD